MLWDPSPKKDTEKFKSLMFSKTERNYCVTRRKLLAVIDSIKFFHYYLYGSKFVIRTDNISLK